MRDDVALQRLANAVLWPGHLGEATPDWVRRERDAGLAGVVLFAQNLGGPPAQDLDGLLVGIDEEGGAVTRLDAAEESRELGAGQLGALDDVDLTRAVAARTARRAGRIGANVILAPVADVNADPANPVIGTRAFGADPSLVERHVAAAIRGTHQSGALAAAKHFPGHGETSVDSHHELPISGASLEAQREVHLRPFAAAIGAGVRMIMTAHIVVPGWGELPATANPLALAELREMRFEGVIVSDALDMAAMQTRFAEQSAVRALAAGCDLLCVSNPANPGSSGDDYGDFLRVRHAVVEAVRAGTLPAGRLEEAASRVAALRAEAAPADPYGSRLQQAVGAARTDGDCLPMPGPRTVVDARAPASWAVGEAGSVTAQVIAAGGEVLPRDSAAGHEADRVVVLVDRLAEAEQRKAVAGAARQADVVVVNLGVDPAPGDEPVCRSAVHLRGASRLAADAAEVLLARGWAQQ